MHSATPSSWSHAVTPQNGHQQTNRQLEEAIWTDSQNKTQWQIIEIRQPTDRSSIFCLPTDKRPVGMLPEMYTLSQLASHGTCQQIGYTEYKKVQGEVVMRVTCRNSNSLWCCSFSVAVDRHKELILCSWLERRHIMCCSSDWDRGPCTGVSVSVIHCCHIDNLCLTDGPRHSRTGRSDVADVYWRRNFRIYTQHIFKHFDVQCNENSLST